MNNERPVTKRWLSQSENLNDFLVVQITPSRSIVVVRFFFPVALAVFLSCFFTEPLLGNAAITNPNPNAVVLDKSNSAFVPCLVCQVVQTTKQTKPRFFPNTLPSHLSQRKPHTSPPHRLVLPPSVDRWRALLVAVLYPREAQLGTKPVKLVRIC